ncbi:MAG: anhydro-N-acetylmuramic acid kinase [Marinirhabdus sp.]|nr:anhydro-N-acetylmuramic acid kinase [Marinirhabdus sp.]
MNLKKSVYSVIGVMSGTSLDGIDLAEVTFRFEDSGVVQYEFGAFQTVPYPDAWKYSLKEAIHYSEGRIRGLNTEYTRYLASVVNTFIKEYSIVELDAICSHGHTIFHQPDKGITLQIGNLPELATLLKQLVVCDFRVQDVVLGGQGAPLVPVGDQLLFSEFDYCLNLGGFANCSFQLHDERIAYDICPVNIVLNRLAEALGVPYDDGGQIAKNGTVNAILLDALNANSYYQKQPPKSLGLEWVATQIFPELEASVISTEDKIATVTEHIAIQLAANFKPHSSVLVTGGGAYNSFLLESVSYHKDLKLKVPEPQLVEFKEALVFAVLGVLRLRGEVNCLASVTGAERDHSSGQIFQYES